MVAKVYMFWFKIFFGLKILISHTWKYDFSAVGGILVFH